jgi:glycosyltransferase involved in cell wall biosynthesis
MRKVVLYGPLPEKKVVGGFDRMNQNIIDEFKGNEEIKVIGLPILKLNLRKPLKQIVYPFAYFYGIIRDILRLKSLIKSEKVDAIHITALYHGIFILREAVIIFYAKIRRLKIIYDIRAGSFINNFNKSKLKFLYMYCLKNSNKILIEGKKYGLFLSQYGFESTYFPNYTMIERYDNNSTTQQNIIRFLYVGRVIKLKGIDESIELISKLRQTSQKDIIFDIIGDYETDYRDNLLSKYHHRNITINFIGYKDKQEISDYFHRADMFLFLTRWHGEGHSNSLNEAMAHGLPIVFYDTGFTREIIGNDKFLLDKDDLEGNVWKLKNILDNYKLYKNEKIRLKELALKEYSLDKMKLDLKEIYDSI